MKSFFLILVFAFALFMIKSEAAKQMISVDDQYYEVDEEVLDELIKDIMKNNGYSAVSGNSSKCTNQGGQCMNPNSCNGTVKSGLCPGGNDNKCCIPKKTTGNSSKCTNQGGQCMNPINCSGTVKSGLCPGGNDNKCCISGPKQTGSSPTVSYSLEQKIKIIYNYFMSNVPGATKNGIAAVLGNWKVESGIEPKRAEADYVSPPIGAASKSDSCWDDDKWLSMTGPQIYKGKYPAILKRGLGLGQWTDTSGSPRNTNLRNYAKSKGKKWYDLTLQLDFMLNGDNSSAITYAKNVLTSNDSVSTLTTRFLNKWEGNKGDKLSQRQSSANEIYNYLVNNF